MKKSFVAVTAFLMLASATTTVLAGATSTATVSGFTVTLYDLNAGDGIAPAIDFTLPTGSYGSYARTSASDGLSGSQTGSAWSLQAFGPSSATSAAGLAQSSAAVSGTLAGGLSLTAQGSAPGTLVLGFGTEYAAAAGVPTVEFFSTLTFSLSPNTLAVFSGSYSLFAQTTVGQVLVPPFTFYTESASASASLSVSGTGPAGSGNQQSGLSQNLFASSLSVFDPQTGQFVYTGQTLSAADSLAASFTNVSGGAITGTLSLTASVSGNSRVLAPIPEPSTYLLMLAGVAALVVRRRKI